MTRIFKKNKKIQYPVGIQGILNVVMKKMEKEDLKGNGKLFLHWKQVVGEELSKHTKPFRIRDQKLTVIVDSSVWLFELQQSYYNKILNRIQKLVGKDQVERIYFKVGV